MTSDTGPFLKAAVFCENVIEGKDGVLSLIRIIDRITITAAGPEVPTEMPQLEGLLKLVLMFVSGRASGTHDVQVRVEKPNGTAVEAWGGTVFFEGEDRGANAVIQMSTEFQFEGLYWFDILFDGAQVTRVPFRLIYQRVAPGTSPQ